ncbi:DUF590-domain-containing protein [Mollisia scopiformis]|uniref:DUF590-domain-containing protein n=1 Tax=Mollisia scopiformis TaxID=149040 RepID=A0A194XV83_MOLSC|nr:DUF590-domain-containing protein [Mollisia scopiformis]KUJ23929.1 DUF590-domain-containing protein [Mollisia scopiformis]
MLDSTVLTQAERLRIVYNLITSPCDKGGAGTTPNGGDWEAVDALLPLHDQEFNKRWLKEWSTKYVLSVEDLTKIRDHYGEKIGFYFAFLQSYFTFLLLPAILGSIAYFVFPSFSIALGFITCLWSVIFVEYWTLQEVDLAVHWRVHGVSTIQHVRPEFKSERETKDLITGETVKVFSPYKRLARQALQIPFALVAGTALGFLITLCFGIEIFISEVYDGPFKSILVYLPTGLLATLEPSLTGILEKVAIRLTDFENYPTADSHEAALIQKTFLFNLITGYLPVFLTAFVYIPYGPLMAPYLDVLDFLAHKYANDPLHPVKPSMSFQVDEWRLRKEVIYFGITAQIIDQFFEVVVPYAKHKWASYIKSRPSFSTKHAAKKSVHTVNDLQDEAVFLTRVRNEIELEEYDVNTDLREMCMQFGYLTNFSIVWPLTPLCFLVNNWIELRSDAVKICFDMRRPVPHRSDTIGPWLSNLGFLTGLGSINTAALIFLFSGEADSESVMWRMRSWGFLATIIASEQLYFGVREFVRYGIRQLESKGLLQERRAQFLARRELLEKAMKVRGAEPARKRSKKGKKRDSQVLTTIGCRDENVGLDSAKKDSGVEKCLKMGRDIMRQEAPQEKKKPS